MRIRIPFDRVERAYLEANDPHDQTGPDRKSYQQIAEYLNRNFAHLNLGQRTSGGIKRFYQERAKERKAAIRHIRIPASMSRDLTGEDLTRIIVTHQNEAE